MQLWVIITDKHEFVQGGGSSSPSFIRAFDDYKKAKRSLGQLQSRTTTPLQIMEFNYVER